MLIFISIFMILIGANFTEFSKYDKPNKKTFDVLHAIENKDDNENSNHNRENKHILQYNDSYIDDVLKELHKIEYLASHTPSRSHRNEKNLGDNANNYNEIYSTQEFLPDLPSTLKGININEHNLNSSNVKHCEITCDVDKKISPEAADTCGYTTINFTVNQANLLREGVYEIEVDENPSVCGIMFTPNGNDLSTNSCIFNVYYSSDEINWTYVNSGVFQEPLNFIWTNSGIYPNRAPITTKTNISRLRIQIKTDRNDNYKFLTSTMTVSLLKDFKKKITSTTISSQNNEDEDSSPLFDHKFGDLGSDSDLLQPAPNYHYLEADVQDESRASIQHPSDGRLIHLDAEDYNIEEPNNVIVDRSLMDSNGFLKKHATIKDEHWSCRHVIKLANHGDRVELQASKMTFVPKLKITVMAYVKIDQLENINPIFSVIGLHPDPFFNQLNLDILQDGSIRWKYVKQSGDIGYEAQTESNIITPDAWNHIVVNYKILNFTNNGIASIYVNGSLKAKYHGNGYIPKDWEGLTMIGADQHDHQLYGSVDEFVIFDRILSDEEIKSESEKCISDRYYSGGNVWSKSGTIMSPHYPSLYKKPVSSNWKITGKPYEIIEVKIDEYVVGDTLDEESCQRTTLIIKETNSGQIIDKVCKLQEPRTYTSKTNSVTILFETSGEPNGIKYKIHFRILNNTISKRSIIVDEATCLYDKVFENMRITNSSILNYIGQLVYRPAKLQIFECANMACQANPTYNTAYASDGLCYGADCGPNHRSCGVISSNQTKELSNEYVAILKITNNKKENVFECDYEDPIENVIFSQRVTSGFSMRKSLEYMDSSKNCKQEFCQNMFDKPVDNVIFSIEDQCLYFNCDTLDSCPMRPYFGAKFNTSVFIPRPLLYKHWKTHYYFTPTFVNLFTEKYNNFFKNSTEIHQVYFDQLSTNVQFKFLYITTNITQCKLYCAIVGQQVCEAVFIMKNLCFSIKCKDVADGCGIIRPDTATFKNLLIPTSSFRGAVDYGLKCDTLKIDRVIPNSRLVHGLNSGKFVNLGKYSTLKKCIQSVCDFQSQSNIVYYIDKICMAVQCFTEESCAYEIFDATPHTAGVINSTIVQLNSALSHSAPPPTISEIQFSENPSKKCYSHSSFVGTLLQNQSKSVAINQGSSFSMVDCVFKCCLMNSCDIAYLEGDVCYIQFCNQPMDCLLSLTDNILYTITYITRNPFDEAPELKILTPCNPISNTNFITATHLHQSNSSDFRKFLAITNNITYCYELCCKMESCDTIFYIGQSCWGYFCNNMKECMVENSPDKIGLSGTVVSNIKSNRFLIHSKSIIIVCSVLAVVVVLIAGLTKIFYFGKKKT